MKQNKANKQTNKHWHKHRKGKHQQHTHIYIYRQASETKSIKTKKLNSEMKNNTSKHPQTHPTPTNPPSYANTNNEE